MAKSMTAEEMEAEATALLEKHNTGELGDEFYDDREVPVVDEGADADDLAAVVPETVNKEVDKGTEVVNEEVDKSKAIGEVFDIEGLDRVAQNRIRAAQSRMHQATQEVSGLRRELEDVKARLIQAGAKPAPVEVVKAVKAPLLDGMTEEEVTALAGEYPDFAKVVRTVRGLQDTIAALNGQLEQVNQRHDQNEQRFESAAQKTEYDKWMGAITKEHPDAEKVRASDMWSGWLDLQPDYVKRAVYDGATAEDMVGIISSFKEDMGIETVSGSSGKPAPPPTGEDNSKLEQARRQASPNLPKAARRHVPEAGPGKTISRREIGNRQKDQEFLMSDAGQAWAKEVDQAVLEGRIVD